ncbi:anti-sigma factor [Georgenia daeguensis]|uniref:Anti-sigma K factor RskA C-terminal domain-containing protein n=1 Tax=Georgenia daeguensis TaxID=908355 RepID=A0ABP8ETC0_9MICO
MSHLDDETVALRALGEHIGPDAEAHLDECERCRTEVAALERVTVSARGGGGAGTLERPGEHVWQRIAAELELAEGPAPAEQAAPAARPVEPVRPVESVRPAEPVRPAERVRPAEPVRPAERVRPAGAPWWQRRTAWVAAASFLVGVGGTALAMNLADTEPEAPVVATAVLEPLPGRQVTGTAAVHQVDGRRVLQVDLADPGEAGYLEVWLLDADAQRLVSLGILSGAEGVFDIPESLDIGEFPVVDISDEPYDGNPAHSGDSIVRGRLV